VKRRLLLVLATAAVLFGMLSTPTTLRADGDPKPTCPSGSVCKP
jgi:hypothetical protein